LKTLLVKSACFSVEWANPSVPKPLNNRLGLKATSVSPVSASAPKADDNRARKITAVKLADTKSPHRVLMTRSLTSLVTKIESSSSAHSVKRRFTIANFGYWRRRQTRRQVAASRPAFFAVRSSRERRLGSSEQRQYMRPRIAKLLQEKGLPLTLFFQD
jgi:hypothetical protein